MKITKVPFYPFEPHFFNTLTQENWKASEIEALFVLLRDVSSKNQGIWEETFSQKMPSEDISLFCRQIYFFRWAQWDKLTESFGSAADPCEPPHWIDLERALMLKYLLGRHHSSQAENLAQKWKMPEETELKQSPWIPEILALETLSQKVGFGMYRELLFPLRSKIRALSEYSAFWCIRAELILATIYQASGSFIDCQFSIRKAQQLLKSYPSLPLQLSLLRRELSLSLESEHYTESQSLLESALKIAEENQFWMEKALILQEKLRMHLMEDNHLQIDLTLRQLEHMVQETGLQTHLLTLVEERCEMALRAGLGAKAKLAISDQVVASRARQELSGLAVALLYLGRAHLEEDQLEQARDCFLEGFQISKQHGYGKCLVRLGFYLSAVYLRLGDKKVSKDYLQQTTNLSKAMGLPIQSICAEVAKSLLFEQKFSLLPFFKAMGSVATFVEIFYYLRNYRLFQRKQLQIYKEGACIEMRPLDLFLAQCRRLRGLYWVPKEQFFTLFSESKIQTIELDPNSDTDLLLELLLNVKTASDSSGIDTSEIHRLLYPNIGFQQEKHGARVRMLISRTRKRLEPFGMELIFDAKTKLYSVHFGDGIHRLDSQLVADPSETTDVPLSSREMEILRTIRDNGPSSMQELQEKTGITRQSLNPWIRKLMDKNAIQASGKTRNLVYSIHPSFPFS